MEQHAGTVNPAATVPSAAPADARRQRWHGHREARRAALVEAAIRAIHRHGASVGMDDVAGAADVSKPVLYRYFADKAELYVAVGRRAADSLLQMLRAELDHDREPRAHVAAVIDSYLRAIEAEPELYRFVTRRAFADRAVEPDLVGSYTALIAAHVSRIIGDRIQSADTAPAEAWGHGVVGLVQAAGDWWLDRRSMSRADLTEHLTTLVWTGLGTTVWAAASHRSEPGPAPLEECGGTETELCDP